MIGESYRTVEKLVRHAQANNIPVAFNPSEYQAKQGAKRLQPVLSRTEVLVLNREEAALLLGRKPEEPIKSLLLGLLKTGPHLVVVTDGKRGAHACDGKHTWFVQAHKVNVVESTGAGDAFASGFIAGLIKKQDIEFALKLALTNAESVVQAYGAKRGLLRMPEALRRMRQHPPRVVKTKV